MNLKNAAQKMKSWAKDEKSQVVSETGLLTLGGIILVGGAVAIMAPGIKEAFTNGMERLTSASEGPGLVADPLGTGQGMGSDWVE